MKKNRDRLTGLPDRASFDRALEAAVTATAGCDGSVSMAVIDIDLFGEVNERLGREAGDAVIHMLGERARAAFPEEVLLSRFGGDAIGVLWADLEKEQAFLRIERFRDDCCGAWIVVADGKTLELELTLSAGLAAYPDDALEAVDVVYRANEALYRAKVSGRNKTCLAREEKMITKTSHYTQGQLLGLRRLAEREGYGEAALLREALNDLLRKHNG
jgi:diguanylate cyclase (GGDEF)-like protein